MTKELSNQAQVAKNIKNFCKSLNVKCSARSDSFSMGNSVHWEVENIDPETYKKISEFADMHQYGHFNGMEDIYEYSNKRKDIPQTKYCSGSNTFTAEYYQKAWELLKNSAVNGSDKPINYDDAKHLMWCSESWSYEDQIERYVYKILKGSEFARDYINDLSIKFWEQIKTKTNINHESINLNNSAVSIEEHIHTKKGFKMFIVILNDRVETDLFNSLLNSCKSLGGWYSRKWGNTPNGFAFKDNTNAQEFINLNFNNELPTEPKKSNESLANKFEDIAQKMQNEIDGKFSNRETNTPKRIAQAAQARMQGEHLQRTQTVLLKLSEMHKNGDITPEFDQFKTKKQIFDLLNTKKSLISNGYHSYYACTGEPALQTDTKKSEQAALLWSLIEPKTKQQLKDEKIRETINNLKLANIPGYFPTPNNIIDLMIEKAEIDKNDRILDPSAGHGAICDKVLNLCKEVKAIEINYSLAEVLDAKDYLIEKPQDFLNVDIKDITTYEKILMNPPFENLQDADHVMHAYKFLKNGGKLVSIMSHGAFFRSDKKAKEFRNWLDNLNYELIDIPAGSFKESGTNIATKMLVINN